MAKERYVFISHASADKPRVRPIVDALIAGGLTPFVDNPAKLGFTPADLPNLKSLRAGADWASQLRDMADNAGCVLVCWSKQALDARVFGKGEVWGREVNIAIDNGTMIPCIIEDFDMGLLAAETSIQQARNLVPQADGSLPATELAQLIADIKTKLNETTTDPGRRDQLRSAAFVTYLAGRGKQEGDFLSVLYAAKSYGGVRPLLFAAPENELPEGFMERVRSVAAKTLGDVWEEKILQWPGAEAVSDFEASYRRELWRNLDPSREPTDEGIAQALAGYRRPVAILHTIMADNWGRNGAKRLEIWLSYWRRIAALQPKTPLLPMIQLVMPPAKPGWTRQADEDDGKGFDCPPDPLFDFARQIRNREIWSGVLALSTPPQTPATEPGFTVLRILPPLTGQDRKDWAVLLTGQNRGGGGVDKTLSKLFDGPGARKGVNHKTFSDQLIPALGEG